jgi:hypothetical protein
MNPTTTKKSLDNRTVLYSVHGAFTVEQAIERARDTARPVALFDHTGSLRARVYPNGDVVL